MSAKRQKIRTWDVVCFGEVLWDIFEGKDGSFRREMGGAPANVAVGLARLGVRSAIAGGVGRDRFGVEITKALDREGVDTRLLVHLPNRTGIAFVSTGARGEPSFLFYRHETADVSLRCEHITKAMGRARWGLVGTSSLMTPSLAGATERFIDVLAGDLVVDLNVRAHLWQDRRAMKRAIARLVRRAALVKASEADLAALGSGFFRTYAPRGRWVVTRSGGTASAYLPGGEVRVPASRARCVDATGAGDAFLAGMVASLVASRARPGSPEWDDPRRWERALSIGHVLGAKAVSSVGAVRGLVRLAAARRMLQVSPSSAASPQRGSHEAQS
jgi:fructokinase